MRLPSGLLIRGRGLRKPVITGPRPHLGVYLQEKKPDPYEWDSRWIRWPDFWLPIDREAFVQSLHEVLLRAESERVEIACSGGSGRTGTAMACLAVLDGIPSNAAVDYVRNNYSRKAVETPWQKRFVARFAVATRRH